jgi:hypothetical protein
MNIIIPLGGFGKRFKNDGYTTPKPLINIFGKPNTGVHSIRIANFAIVDIVFTIIGAWLLSMGLNIPFWICLVILFVSGILLHRMFCVRTTIDKLLFP